MKTKTKKYVEKCNQGIENVRNKFRMQAFSRKIGRNELAKILGCSIRTIEGWEQGRNVSKKYLKRLKKNDEWKSICSLVQ